MTEDGFYIFSKDPRKEKILLRKHIPQAVCPVRVAHDLGCEHAYSGKDHRNPYPQGRRHDEYKNGYESADPMGRYMGSNI